MYKFRSISNITAKNQHKRLFTSRKQKQTDLESVGSQLLQLTEEVQESASALAIQTQQKAESDAFYNGKVEVEIAVLNHH